MNALNLLRHSGGFSYSVVSSKPHQTRCETEMNEAELDHEELQMVSLVIVKLWWECISLLLCLIFS